MRMFIRKVQKAFSIVEIMVAVSIMAIVMVLAITAYTRYLAKQMVVKAINATAYLRQAVEDYYVLYGFLPGNRDLMTGPGAPYIKGYNTGASQPEYPYPEQDISRIAYYNSYGDYCNSSASGCTSTGDTLMRQVEVSFSNPTSTAAKLLSATTFVMRINLNGGVINWECASYNWNSSPYSTTGTDGTLLPVSCYNSALNS